MAVQSWNCNDTYSLAFFFGPGFPLGFGIPSAPKAAAAVLLMPFFFGGSEGGGINEEAELPFGMGVLEAGLRAFATESSVGGGETKSFGGDASCLTSVLTAGGSKGNFSKLLDDSFNLTIRLCLVDFRRAAADSAGLFVDAMVPAGVC